jgi:Domain of unknown function (DUF4386)
MTTATAASLAPRPEAIASASSGRLPRAAGIAYLVTIVASIPAQFYFYAPVLTDPDYVTGAGADGRVLTGGALEVLTALACVATAVALYPLTRRHSPGAAIGFVAARTLEAALIAVGIVSTLSVVTLRDDTASAAEAAALTTTAKALVAVHDWTFLLGPGVMPGVNALLLGYALYRSRLVPRLIPATGLVAAPLFLTAGLLTVLGINTQVSLWTALVTAPIFVWELSLGLWLTFKGTATATRIHR